MQEITLSDNILNTLTVDNLVKYNYISYKSFLNPLLCNGRIYLTYTFK